tara:strand:+ start:23216 stop:23557 length:342 start_codon:yes stop_codon:yes gene_type:complete
MDENDKNIISVLKQAKAPAITVDYDLYAHFLDDADLTEDQKREFLQAIWNIIVEFVSLGFDVHPAQQMQNDCGQLPKASLKATLTNSHAINCEDQKLSGNFDNAADLATKQRT